LRDELHLLGVAGELGGFGHIKKCSGERAGTVSASI
jgi:hypothetical protein